jgi:molybdenum cofactor biosynthesis enzyme MoaA
MKDFTRNKNPRFIEFKTRVEDELTRNPKLIRLDCLNPMKAFPHEFDFSTIPNITLTSAWAEYLNVKFKYSFLSSGVRDALFCIFSTMKGAARAFKIAIPSDVYPVYEQILNSIGVPYYTYRNITHHYSPLEAIKDNPTVALITAPMFGRDLTAEEIEVLTKWLMESADRHLIIDRVYDYSNGATMQPLIDTDQVTICYSLSKTHLSPLMSGFNITSSKMSVSSNYREDERAVVLLTTYRNFPQVQEEFFQKRWRRLKVNPLSGYLAVKDTSFEQILENGGLAVPGIVYGLSESSSVISCLHESNGHVLMNYVTVASNFAKGYDKYSRRYSKELIPESTFPNRFYLLETDLEAGFNKAKKLLAKTPDGDRIIVIQTRIDIDHLSPAKVGESVERNWIKVESVLDEGMNPIQIEDLYAESLELNGGLMDWESLLPRSLSVLPIARACQAKCDFCFSHSSISEDQHQGRIFLDKMEKLCEKSKSLGSNRLVITGGGEPTMLAHHKLLDIMNTGKKFFDKIVMITNGYELGHSDHPFQIMKDYVESGLTVLSISRHSDTNNSNIMHLDTRSEIAADVWRNNRKRLNGLILRWVCVLQKEGVANKATLERYLDWVVETGVEEICFKELYVAATNESVYHDSEYNVWCVAHQVPLNLVIDFMEANQAKKINKLPWGSPIYSLKWKGKELKIAAYTEPNMFWERKNGICRSWNLMADGKCYANLETTKSLIGQDLIRLNIHNSGNKA